MSGDEKSKEVKELIVEEAKAVGVEVYKDALRPTVSVVGDTAGNIAKLFLSPVNAIAKGLNGAFERLAARVGMRLEGVPPERQLPPPATIAAPIAFNYAMLGDGDEVADLREMFENLLFAAMDRQTSPNVHPAFVSMISQMTPDEAWLLKSITRPDYAVADVYDRSSPEGRRPIGFHTKLGLGTGIDESRQRQYISNLERLGILRIDFSATASDHSEHDALDEYLNREIGTNWDGHAGAISVTPLCQQFLSTCVRVRR